MVVTKPREKLFSVTAQDCEWQFFTAGGKGGQKQNKTASACRVVHPPSGAVGESREYREQPQNKKAAFKRMTETKEFQKWLNIETKKYMGQLAQIEYEVEQQMKKVQIEVKDETGKWVKAKESELK
jgi:protein subunit release factor B